MAEQRAGEEPSKLFLAASYLVMFVGGALLAVFGAFLLPYSASPAAGTRSPAGGATSSAHVLAAGSGGGLGQLLSVGLLVALVANPALSLAGLWTAGTRLAAFAPLAGWLPVVLFLASSRPSGSVVLTSDLRSVAFLLLGALAFTAVAALGRPARGKTSLIGQPLAGRGARGRPPPPTDRGKPAVGRTAPRGNRRR